MKTTFALAGLALALSTICPAQDNSGERVVVPARNSSRPRKVTVRSNNGPITVKTYAGKDVIVETLAGEARRDRRPAPEGMRRIDALPRGLTVEEQDNQIEVHQSVMSHGTLTITVPADTSLDLHSLHGEVNVDGVHGEIVVDSLNSRVNVTNVSGNVLAHSLNGGIKVTMDRVDPAKPLSFITLNGTIDVTLPADYKGNVRASTHNGAIYTDFEFRLGAGVITRSNDTGDGKYKVKIDEDGITGTINGGGPEATFKSHNGTIYIRKKK
jgi:DUF4097 and DUF4098 domain-containing protein YvlB